MDPPRANVAVCESEGWFGFMVEVLYPTAQRITVAPGDTVSSVLASLPSSTRGLLVNINLSHTSGFLNPDTAWPLPVLNGGATDVRKHTLHARAEAMGLPTARANQSGPPDERVIVKTTLNYAGKPERQMRERWGTLADPFIKDLGETTDYVVSRREEVAPATWTDPSLVVERYITNPDGLFIRAYVVGPAAVVTLAWATTDIKKLSLPQSDRRDYYFWDTAPLGPTSDVALGGFLVFWPVFFSLRGVRTRRRLLWRRLRGRCRRHDHAGRCQQDALLGPPAPVPCTRPSAPWIQRADW
jgi:hypothetical protein